MAKSSSSSLPPGEVVLGKVSGIFGVRGELRLMLNNRESPWLFERARQVTLRAPDGEERLVSLRARPGAGKRVLGKVEGLEDREQARALMEWQLVVPRSALPEPEPGAYYLHDLLGRPVSTSSGRALGRLAVVHQNTPIDLWEIAGEGVRYYLPIFEDTLLGVDERGILVCDERLVEAD